MQHSVIHLELFQSKHMVQIPNSKFIAVQFEN